MLAHLFAAGMLHACSSIAWGGKRFCAAGTGDYMPELSEESGLLGDEDVRALAMAVPIRHRWARWRLLYATARDGISLQTLYR